MRKKFLPVAIACAFSTLVLMTSHVQAAAEEAVATPASSEPSVKDRTRQLAANSRKRKTMEQFEASLRRSYPESYQMISQLGTEDKQAIFAAYKAGDPMADVRRQIIEQYAAMPKN